MWMTVTLFAEYIFNSMLKPSSLRIDAIAKNMSNNFITSHILGIKPGSFCDTRDYIMSIRTQ